MPAIDSPVVPPASPPTSALVVDVGKADAATLAGLKHAGGVRWWLELGDALLLVGEQGDLRRAAKDPGILAEIPGFDASR
ncbi:MAG TPA: hypothetical protein PKC03_10580, partial [Dokdonella sp.]|nr:hypothetical protein [Dokdonella sp.]